MDQPAPRQAPYFDLDLLREETSELAHAHSGQDNLLRKALVERLAPSRRRRLCHGQAPARGGRRRPRLRRRPVGLPGRADQARLRLHHHPRLPRRQSLDRGAHGRGRPRRLWPRPARAGLRHRSAVPASLQADRLGRERRRVHALSALGSRLQGRPRHPHHRPMRAAQPLRHDHPHGAARCAPDPRRRGAVTPISSTASARKCSKAMRGRSSRRSSPSRMPATPAPAPRAIWSSRTSRTARAACATCTLCTGSPSTSIPTRQRPSSSRPACSRRHEYRSFRRCESFLWTVRCELHFLTDRPEERLGFDLQQPMAERLGYRGKGGLSAVERFMRHYFLVAKEVGELTGIVCSALEMKQLKSLPVARHDSRPVQLAPPRQAQAYLGLPHRERPHLHHRQGRVRQGPGELHPAVRGGR